MKRQLLSLDAHIRNSGTMTFAGRGTTPDDLVSLLLLAAQADSERLLPMSPYVRRPRISRADVFRQLDERFGDRDFGPGPGGQHGRWLVETDGTPREVSFE